MTPSTRATSAGSVILCNTDIWLHQLVPLLQDLLFSVTQTYNSSARSIRLPNGNRTAAKWHINKRCSNTWWMFERMRHFYQPFSDTVSGVVVLIEQFLGHVTESRKSVFLQSNQITTYLPSSKIFILSLHAVVHLYMAVDCDNTTLILTLCVLTAVWLNIFHHG